MITAYDLLVGYFAIGAVFTWLVIIFDDEEIEFDSALAVVFMVFTVLWPYFICIAIDEAARRDGEL